MKTRATIALAAVLGIAVSLGAQAPLGYVTLSASKISDSTGAKLANGTIKFAPVDNNGKPISYQPGGTGQHLSKPVTTLVTNGAFTIQIADSGQTKPANVCFSVTITDNVSGASVLGPGYTCMQPMGAFGATPATFCTASGVSGQGGTCNFDLFVPNLAGNIMVQTGPPGPPGPAGSSGAPGPPGTIANFSGNSQGGAMMASINSQINVKAAPYNAVGDCVADDHNAIVAAQTAALAYATGANLPAALYFPKGCYLTSTIQWAGVPLVGQPSGCGLITGQQFGVVIKSMPGQDILHVPDPTTSTFTWYGSWSIRDISFSIDNNVCAVTSSTCTIGSNPVFANRTPGRWFDDGAMTSGSATFTSPNALIGCGDIGQAIQVNGAGPSGANLVTTISNVVPCWANAASNIRAAWQTVTLAANASTTVTAAHGYLSLLGFPVTTRVGNCAIAMDDVDGKPADFVSPTQNVGSYAPIIDNTTFGFTGTNFTNSVCGIFTQGAHILYKISVNHFAFNSSFGVVQTTAVLNSYSASTSGDFEVWENGFFQTFNPWISYNGIDNILSGIELNGDSGLQILQSANVASDVASGWDISIPEFENTLSGGLTYGTRITGTGHTLSPVSFAAPSVPGMVGVLDTQGSTGTVQGPINLYGSGNTISSYFGTGTLSDLGRGNTVINAPDISTPPAFAPPTNLTSPSVMKNNPAISGPYAWYPDFLSDSNATTTPYKHTDMWLIPRDLVPSGAPYANSIVTDTNAMFGESMVWNAGAALDSFTQFIGGGGTRYMIVGTNVPAGPVTVFGGLRCTTPSSTFHFHVNTSGGYIGGSNSVTCGTSFSVVQVRADFTGQTGHVEFINDSSVSSNNAWLEWLYVQPRQGLNGIPGVGVGAGIPSGPVSTTANDLVVYADNAATQASASSPTTIVVNKAMGNGIPTMTFNNTTSTPSGNYAVGFQHFAPNVLAGAHLQGWEFGIGHGANNECHNIFENIGGSGSASNTYGISCWTTSLLSCNVATGVCNFPQSLTINGANVPTTGTPTAGQAACIKAAGPPVVIGYCSTVVSSSGACTCN
jgi:hypothetical protein